MIRLSVSIEPPFFVTLQVYVVVAVGLAVMLFVFVAESPVAGVHSYVSPVVLVVSVVLSPLHISTAV